MAFEFFKIGSKYQCLSIHIYIIPCVRNKWAYNVGFIQEPLANTQVRMFNLFFMYLFFFQYVYTVRVIVKVYCEETLFAGVS